MKRKGILKFSRETATVLWKHKLSNMCLDSRKVKNSLPNRSPVKLVNPRKLELYLSKLIFCMCVYTYIVKMNL
ncbi:hypothetical protein TSAR_006703 [Trichomalopsis sarcophagae]|uniref:Uncharacterized protein n=1 Tax=Trichomalopsis sarcophagae TaxID=543379 RepID=A0A232EJF9_9HYME|nr:hypothetical protein TSAR_006703 [Trichomalopsis sarcophagae]